MANDSIIFKTNSGLLNISSYLDIYEDVSGKLNFNDILSKKFERTKGDVPNLGITESVFWVKVKINNASEDEHLLMDLSLATLDNIEFYYPYSNGKYGVLCRGERFPFYQRKYIDIDYLFDIDIPINTSKVYYLKVSSNEGIQLPMTIGSENDTFTHLKNRDILSGMYFGLMIAMIFYNLFIYFSVKDKSYLYYVAYIILILITQTSVQGYPFQYLWPSYPMVAQKSLFIFPSLVSIAGLEFIRLFLQIKKRSYVLYVISYFFYIPYITSILLAFFGYYKISFYMMEVSSTCVSIYMLAASIIILRQGFQPAKYFLVGWSVFLVGICIYTMKDFGILPFNNFTRYTMHIGSAIETILLSFALAARINIYKKEKEASQAEALEISKENERIIKEQNLILETKVKERTSELETSNANLKNTQTQLVNAEKMAALGQLTAGIAHEINNPINFVSANVKPLKMDIDDLLGLIKKYEAMKPSVENTDEIKAIETYKKKIDLDYLKTEIDALLTGIEDGAKRTAEIVSGLKNFSRLDESEIKIANINEGIESTLVLLRSTIPENTDVEVDLGNIPAIECLPGKLNQVFMNLLSNAFYAINKKKTTEKNKLAIKTYELNDMVYVSIQDTGIGMTEETQSKIFEPFFTTKDVGEGTGLGMSIVFKIIESHHAKIEIDSQYGIGTKILLILNKQIDHN